MPRDPLELLARPDKWYLGAGDGLIWAPPFPVWHDTPGFWDDAHLVQYPLGPLFTVSFVTPDGRPWGELPRAQERRWTPAGLTCRYGLTPGLRAQEIRVAPGERRLVSQWELSVAGSVARTVHVVAWTAVDGAGVAEDGVSLGAGALLLDRTVRDRKGQELAVRLEYRLQGGTSWAARRSEGAGHTPDFRTTPFYDRWDGTGLGNEIRLGGLDRRGLVYLGLHRRLRLTPGRPARFGVSVRITRPGTERGSPRAARSIPDREVSLARRGWRNLVAAVPGFRCSDPWFDRYWWYRWYGLRLNRVPAGLGTYRHDTVCEGIGYFHQPISYSAMCHVRELRWHRDPTWARGVVHTFFDRLGPDGSLPGRVYLEHQVEPDFYHADWGGALEDLEASHPGGAWLSRLAPSLARYAEWLVASRDPDGSGMIDVLDQYETGQEYMSRYEAVDPGADRYGWENRIRLKGIDVTVYAWRLFRLLARTLPEAGARHRWAERAERTARAVRERMWDPASGMFSDLDPRTGGRTGIRAAVCFYPYLTELAGEHHVAGFGAHLFDPAQFWTPYPVPSSSGDDPRFDPNAEWKGKRHNCPWNGRVWPMVTSHVVDALARVVRWHRPEWAPRLVDLLHRFVRMMTDHGDPARPNCFEHYHPFTGRASRYRGFDDYQHSWVNDLLARHVAGLLPAGEAGVTVDPMPFGGTTELRGARIAGHRVDVLVEDATFRVRVNGRVAGRGRVGRALEIAW